MAVDLVARMTRAYGDPIMFAGSPYLQTNSEYFRRHDGSAVVMTNNGVRFSEETQQQMQAYMIGHLLAERAGYTRKIFTECAIREDAVKAAKERLVSYPVRDEVVLVDEPHIRMMMTGSASFLQRVAVNNIMASAFGVDVTGEYYYLENTDLVRDLSLKVDRHLISLGGYYGLEKVPQYIKYNIGMQTLFLAENYLYSNDESRIELDKFMLTSAFINDLIRALGLDVPREQLFGPKLREDLYTVARYKNALEFLQGHLGARTLFYPRIMDQHACDTLWLNEARNAIEFFENPLEHESVETLLEALDNLLKVQTLDADREIEKIYDLVLERSEERGTLSIPEIRNILVDICTTKKLAFAATLFEERLSR